MNVPPAGAHDAPDITVRLVRATTPFLVLIRNANAWVLRKPILVLEDVD